ncbi:hypothetical protein [Stackebrandtia nassauensis]|uniref:Uncharacterized protein n=1 Tax=Stackebrandtia nassauensis (strain DSM 44728 / CIP 108903 / NRRL B-16338 / NBRC 102104 / LLR-40K-21) TaxID=446470 RepID=D3PWP6_STANL|nr:hypothetical protein [Stackebrandtia nassauensis]ADD43268.1 hypothetical protein Snas_3608 [Stackebrandtia nassauensis DSM 44728]
MTGNTPAPVSSPQPMTLEEAARTVELPLELARYWSQPERRRAYFWPEPLATSATAYDREDIAAYRLFLDQCVDVEEAAAVVDMPVSTAKVYSSPKERAKRGWPEPADTRPAASRGKPKPLFRIRDLLVYKHHQQPPTRIRRGDPNDLIGVEEFATEIQVSESVMNTYVTWSLPDWRSGNDGYLPMPVDSQPARNGNVYWWRRSQAWTCNENRRHRPGGRPQGQRPTTHMLREVLLSQPYKSVADLAALLSQHVPQPVSIQVTRRLLSQLRRQVLSDELLPAFPDIAPGTDRDELRRTIESRPDTDEAAHASRQLTIMNDLETALTQKVPVKLNAGTLEQLLTKLRDD